MRLFKRTTECHIKEMRHVAILYLTLPEWSNALPKYFTPRHHNDANTTSWQQHPFDHILRCTRPIFYKLKPLDAPWVNSSCSEKKISKIKDTQTEVNALV
jgi:hypothetical protein